MQIDPPSTAVLAIHLQGDIVAPDGAFAGMFQQQVVERDVLATAARVLAGARSAGVQVVYTRVAFAPDYSNMIANSPLLAGTAEAGCLKDGSPLAEIVSEVAPGPQDIVVTHQRVGGFADSNLDEVLQSAGLRTLIVMGVATNASVETTARWASDLAYRTVLVEDACSAANLEAHQASIASLGMLAEITTSAEVLSALTAVAATGV